MDSISSPVRTRRINLLIPIKNQQSVGQKEKIYREISFILPLQWSNVLLISDQSLQQYRRNETFFIYVERPILTSDINMYTRCQQEIKTILKKKNLQKTVFIQSFKVMIFGLFLENLWESRALDLSTCKSCYGLCQEDIVYCQQMSLNLPCYLHENRNQNAVILALMCLQLLLSPVWVLFFISTCVCFVLIIALHVFCCVFFLVFFAVLT